MAELTDSIDVLTRAVRDLLELAKPALAGDVQDVWLGDQDRLPRTPCLTVEPGGKSRDYNGAPRRFLVTLDTYIMVYIEKIQDATANTELLMEVSESVEDALHADAQLGGLVVASFVMSSEPGYATRGGTLMRASRLTFRATSQKMLPYTSPS